MGIVSLFLFLHLSPACPAEGWITSEYGYREDPITHKRGFHQGIDIANKEGTPLFAPWSGKILKVTRARDSGLFVVLQTGELRWTFMHLKAANVHQGDQVYRGDQLGALGQSGRATGPHVHLEVRHHGKTQDPSLSLRTCPRLP